MSIFQAKLDSAFELRRWFVDQKFLQASNYFLKKGLTGTIMHRLLGGIADGDFLARIDGITLAARRHVDEICGVELIFLRFDTVQCCVFVMYR